MSRRAFLETLAIGAAGTAAAALPSCAGPEAPLPAPGEASRVVLLRFGGGVRFDDVYGPQDRCLAPSLRAAAAEGTLYTDLRAGNLTVHDAATGYLLTGRYGEKKSSNDQREENLAELQAYPTVFELFRGAGNRDPEKALAVGVPPHFEAERGGRSYAALSYVRASDFRQGSSPTGDPSLGPLPERVMFNQRIGRLVRDLGPGFHSRLEELDRAQVLGVARERLALEPLDHPQLGDALAEAMTERVLDRRPWVPLDDADDLTLDLATRAMRRLRPELVVIGFATPDVAHFGAWRNYAAQVRRCDQALARLRAFLAEEPFYRGRTLLLVTPDCGRGDPGFDDHRVPFDEEAHRRLFALALGPGVRPGLVVDERREQVDVAATLAAALRFSIPGADGRALEEVLG